MKTLKSQWTEQEITALAQEYESQSPEAILSWAVKTLGNRCTLACSFGAEDVVLLDMLMNINSEAPVFYLDTDKHFPETYQTRDKLSEKYGVSFIQVKPALTLKEQRLRHGDKLWETNPDLCCQIRKVEPLKETLNKYDAWVTGIRREQSWTRRHSKKVEWDEKFGLLKLNPLADWSEEDIWTYIEQHDVPYNPLHDQNYPSIGCSVCTRPVQDGQDPRSGRWGGYQKTECGLHK
ncbi:phosphoadenylyl-sulfate reductase [Caldalkalibacillus salinus]|uniref:phosphoadenylyl-sulfate reductase n=1 Tax=Caldalkalibacillus salinus TaxID=2803787 RepID=UPI001921CE88|nr:phosphoadenylyl-sulfate reductase [Caldalkalibacillus salinus]